MYKIRLINIFRHLHVVNRHRFKVFLLCLRCGIVWQGLIHDLSKYSFTEFFEGVKYFQGNRSPIEACKEDIGYSLAWLHHKGRNKHHYEYWYDYSLKENSPVIPFKYYCEMMCDNIAAGMIYNKGSWTEYKSLEFWNNKREKLKPFLNKKMINLLDASFSEMIKVGYKQFIKKDNLKKIYNKNTR